MVIAVEHSVITEQMGLGDQRLYGKRGGEEEETPKSSMGAEVAWMPFAGMEHTKG